MILSVNMGNHVECIGYKYYNHAINWHKQTKLWALPQLHIYFEPTATS